MPAYKSYWLIRMRMWPARFRLSTLSAITGTWVSWLVTRMWRLVLIRKGLSISGIVKKHATKRLQRNMDCLQMKLRLMLMLSIWELERVYLLRLATMFRWWIIKPMLSQQLMISIQINGAHLMVHPKLVSIILATLTNVLIMVLCWLLRLWSSCYVLVVVVLQVLTLMLQRLRIS